MGDAKLSVFFSPDEVAQLHAIGRVASCVQQVAQRVAREFFEYRWGGSIIF